MHGVTLLFQFDILQPRNRYVIHSPHVNDYHVPWSKRSYDSFVALTVVVWQQERQLACCNRGLRILKCSSWSTFWLSWTDVK